MVWELVLYQHCIKHPFDSLKYSCGWLFKTVYQTAILFSGFWSELQAHCILLCSSQPASWKENWAVVTEAQFSTQVLWDGFPQMASIFTIEMSCLFASLLTFIPLVIFWMLKINGSWLGSIYMLQTQLQRTSCHMSLTFTRSYVGFFYGFV